MDAEKKKPIMIAIVIGCLVLAGVITMLTSKSDESGKKFHPKDEIQMLCVNPDCNAEFTMVRKDYDEQMMIASQGIPMMSRIMSPPALTCPQCEQQSAYKAIKCNQCEYVFMSGEAEDEMWPDRCPECDYSEQEQKRDQKQTKQKE